MTLSSRHRACTQCREKKIRCDGAQPRCRGCARHGYTCCYAPASRRYTKADLATMLDGMNRRLLQAEAASAVALPWPSLPPAGAAQTTLGGVSPELALSFGSQLQAPADSDFPMVLDGMDKSLLQTETAGSSTTPMLVRGNDPTSELDLYFGSSFHSPAGLAPVSIHEGDSGNQLDTLAPQPVPFDSRADSQAPLGVRASHLEDTHQPVSLFGRLGFGSQPDPSAGGQPNGQSRPVPTSNSVTLGDQLEHEGQRSQDNQSLHSGTTSNRLETAAGSVCWTDSTSITPDPSPLPSSSPVLNPCSSSMRRKIGNGASFQGLPTLTGPDNYTSWVRAMRAAARKEGVWDMMTGLCERPGTPPPEASPATRQRHNDDMTYWLTKRELALGAIEGSLADDLQARIEGIECAREVWLAVERACTVSKEQALLDAVRKLKGLSGEASVGGIDRLAGRIRELRVDMQCVSALPRVPEWYFAVQFLVSLPPVFDDLVSSVTSSGSCATDLGSEGSLEQVVALAKAEEQRMFAL